MADDSSKPVSRRSFVAATGAAGALALAGCTSNPNVGGDGGGGDGGDGSGGGTTTGQNLSGSITITGSSTVYPLSVAVAEKFRKQHSDVQMDISPTGSGGG